MFGGLGVTRILVLPSVIVLAACGDATSPGDPQLILESHWVLTRVETADGSVDPNGLDERPTLTFGLDAVPESITVPVGGFGGCNGFGGRAEVGEGTISFIEIFATDIGCAPVIMAVEIPYFNVLSGAVRYETGKDRLVIVDGVGGRAEFEGLAQ